MAPLSREQVAGWVDYVEAPWGRLRRELIRAGLERHAARRPGRVLDVGCGLGELAIDFARAGSEVVAADASEAMLTEARARARDAPVRWLVADLDGVVAQLAGERFDLVLCHNVLGYVPEPAAATAGLAGLVAPGGTLSLTLLNRVASRCGKPSCFATSVPRSPSLSGTTRRGSVPCSASTPASTSLTRRPAGSWRQDSS
jgi:S-adenosylmethionine-dependent methyltransferase